MYLLPAQNPLTIAIVTFDTHITQSRLTESIHIHSYIHFHSINIPKSNSPTTLKKERKRGKKLHTYIAKKWPKYPLAAPRSSSQPSSKPQPSSSPSYSYISGVPRSPKTLYELTDELHALIKILAILRDHTEGATLKTDSASLGAILARYGLLEKCSSELDDLRKSIEPDGGGFRGVVCDGPRWPFGDVRTSEYILVVGRLRSFFKCALLRDDR